MTALLAMPTTVAGLLGAHDPAVLAPALRRAGAAASALTGATLPPAVRLPPGAHRTVDERVGRVLHELLDLDLGQLVLDTWIGRPDLARAASWTRAGRSSAEVTLPDHRIAIGHQPAVDVLAGGVAVAVLRFELVVELSLTGVLAAVRGGRLVAVRRGRLVADAALYLLGADPPRPADGAHPPAARQESHHQEISRSDGGLADTGLPVRVPVRPGPAGARLTPVPDDPAGRLLLSGTGRGPVPALLRLGRGAVLLPGADPDPPAVVRALPPPPGDDPSS